MKCEVCGCENKENALFCAKCGKALKEEPIALDLQEIKVPAASRKARIVKVNTKKSADDTQQAQNGEQAAENMVLFNPEKEAVEQADKKAKEAQEKKAQETEKPVEEQEESNFIPLKEASTPSDETAKKTEWKNLIDRTTVPMKIKNWIPVFILSAIPVINLIMLFVWSFSSRTNKSKQSFARLSLIVMLICVVLTVIAVILLKTVFQVNFGTIIQSVKL